MASEKPFSKNARAFRNWSNEVQYRRVDFTDQKIVGDFLAGTLGKGTYIVHVKNEGLTITPTLTEGTFLTDDTDITVTVTGGTEAVPQRMVIAYVPVTTENLGIDL